MPSPQVLGSLLLRQLISFSCDPSSEKQIKINGFQITLCWLR